MLQELSDTDAGRRGARAPRKRKAGGHDQPGSANAARQQALNASLLVAREYGIDVCALYSARRGPARIASARQLAMYLVHVAHGVALTAVGDAFGRDRTTVAHACMVMEERRDDPVFDAFVMRLEMSLPVRMSGPGWR